MITLSSPITDLKGVGKQFEKKLYELNIVTVRDLLFHFPFRWDDFSETVSITQLKPEQKMTVQGKLIEIGNKRIPFRRLTITEALVSDETGSLKIVWFNQPFLKTSLKIGETYRFSGKTKISRSELILQSPSFEATEREVTQTGGLIPVYHVTEGITPKRLRYLIRQALPAASELKEYLPAETVKRQNLIPLKEAVQQIHFPNSRAEARAGKKRLGFDELFIFQLNYQLRKASWQKNQAPKIKKNIPLIKKTLTKLPFELTNDQKLALWEIIKDCNQTLPMNRLLEGDVGSGKTVVATLAALNIAYEKYQSAIMAPTEILARQHFEKIAPLAQTFGLPAALLTNSMSVIATKSKRKIKKEKLIEKIKKSEVKLVIGTHAIIQKNITFKNLALVVVDEQHRFGVRQRSHLIKAAAKIKDGLPATIPHLLSMTATPIPRSLALTIYGDLDLSLIKQLPAGRKKIITRVVPPNARARAYQFIKKQITAGRQAFVICPLIEESETIETKAAEIEYLKLKEEIFPDLKIGLLHGRLKSKEKEAVMKKFSENQLQILVSTSVVEVGVDVPNATVMVIEGAERFGLSQLHQFRGRVGRGKHQSYCLLFTESPSAKTWTRLKYMEETLDGFELANRDLELRGPGEFLGEQQSGFLHLTMASLKDTRLIKAVRAEAEILVRKDPQLKTVPKLKERMKRFNQEVHFE